MNFDDKVDQVRFTIRQVKGGSVETKTFNVNRSKVKFNIAEVWWSLKGKKDPYYQKAEVLVDGRWITKIEDCDN